MKKIGKLVLAAMILIALAMGCAQSAEQKLAKLEAQYEKTIEKLLTANSESEMAKIEKEIARLEAEMDKLKSK